MALRACGLIAVLLLVVLVACARRAVVEPVFHADGNPPMLSDWRLFDVDAGELQLATRVTAYDLNSPLFSDYAHKLRTVWLPAGAAARYSPDDTFDFPVGTILSKTFYYPRASSAEATSSAVARRVDVTSARLAEGFRLAQVRLIETRLLVRRDAGWVAFPYVWNEAQTDAVLRRAGDLRALTLVSQDRAATEFAYLVPDANQCAGCHATNATTRKLQPIGPKARHLNKDYAYADGVENQLARWQALGLLDAAAPLEGATRNAVWNDPAATLDDRARAYLDINCAHCHNEVGPADTSGLHLQAGAPLGVQLGVCKPPIAAGTGTGNRRFDIVPGAPQASIFTYRIASTNPAEMMPELGRSLAHEEGVALISDWISAMPGSCD